MKSKKSFLIIFLLVIMLLSLPVQAASENYVLDGAGYLSESQLEGLEKMATAVSEKYNCGVYILTVPDMEEMGYGSDSYVVTYSYYHDNALGMGDERNGIIVFISAAYRDYAVFVYGEGAEYAFDEYGLEELENRYIGYLSEDDWYVGFKTYISGCEEYLRLASEGMPVREDAAGSIGLGIIVGVIVAFIVCGKHKKQLKSVQKEKEALAYNVGGIDLTKKVDKYSHTTVTRREICDDDDDGPSTSARSGGGGHGRSGKI